MWACLWLCEFAKSRKVIGFDINASRIAELQAGKDSTLEVSERRAHGRSPVQLTRQIRHC